MAADGIIIIIHAANGQIEFAVRSFLTPEELRVRYTHKYICGCVYELRVYIYELLVSAASGASARRKVFRGENNFSQNFYTVQKLY